jgi:hypothetical protein
MSKSKDPAAAQGTSSRRARRTSAAVIAQYVQDLSATQRNRRSRSEPAARIFPSRVVPVRC